MIMLFYSWLLKHPSGRLVLGGTMISLRNESTDTDDTTDIPQLVLYVLESLKPICKRR